uniref:RNA-directed DNA polymerase, eukaryota, reverse transcriptase zinc-binding domain protein n=1 Tax=Tanacetum cinerariifolium TaxID=118510 RepID=A0A699HD32_TANCI|nr:RNA-directed DNA polymerase, eukaryota, reverse transcriptase zinc-binding domain protein [Tanacetum cinerariifolium]
MTKGCSVCLIKYIVNIDDFKTSLPEGLSIRYIVWSLVTGEREEDSFLVMNLSGKVVQYKLISKTKGVVASITTEIPSLPITELHGQNRGSVLVNESPTKEFQFHKGLKQGDSLSDFLFILVMESLHVLFQRVADAGQWSQCNIDTIIRVLDVFYRASGLMINMNKSNLMGIFVDSNKVKHATAKIGCLVLKTPFNNLGSRVGDLMSRIQSWHDVTEGMHTRLSKWKLKTLSIGGRLTLLKFVLVAIPIYHMSIFKVPMKVLQNMESIHARFFNGVDVNSKKPSWVRWKSVLAAKDVGGLGVSSLFALNRALMFKWVWRFFS